MTHTGDLDKSTQGFTLVEVAIVLLIVVCCLVGCYPQYPARWSSSKGMNSKQIDEIKGD